MAVLRETEVEQWRQERQSPKKVGTWLLKHGAREIDLDDLVGQKSLYYVPTEDVAIKLEKRLSNLFYFQEPQFAIKWENNRAKASPGAMMYWYGLGEELHLRYKDISESTYVLKGNLYIPDQQDHSHILSMIKK